MTSEEASARRLLLRGRVQGVGFRYFTVRLGRSMGLTGRVRNLGDGGVEIFVAGPAAAVGAFTEAVRQGPPGARVTALDEERLPAEPGWEGFEITY